MSKPEILILLSSLDALLKKDETDKAKEVIKQAMKEVETLPKSKDRPMQPLPNKVELSLNKNLLGKERTEEIYQTIDNMFEGEQLFCAEKTDNGRTYAGTDPKKDFVRFWSVLFGIKDRPEIADSLQTCFWYTYRGVKEDALAEFFRRRR